MMVEWESTRNHKRKKEVKKAWNEIRDKKNKKMYKEKKSKAKKAVARAKKHAYEDLYDMIRNERR